MQFHIIAEVEVPASRWECSSSSLLFLGWSIVDAKPSDKGPHLTRVLCKKEAATEVDVQQLSVLASITGGDIVNIAPDEKTRKGLRAQMDKKKQKVYIPVTVEELPVLREALYSYRGKLALSVHRGEPGKEANKEAWELIESLIDKTPKIEEDVPF